MGANKRLFTDRLLAWWRGTPSSKKTKRTMSREECMEDPDAALAQLQEEQSRIAQDLEDTFVAYDKKLQAMARQLSGLDEEPVTAKDVLRLRGEQVQLWRLLRRAQAAARGTRELTHELKEWQSREAGSAPFGHPDHPETRAELVASELRVRGVGVGSGSWQQAEGRVGFNGSSKDVAEEMLSRPVRATQCPSAKFTLSRAEGLRTGSARTTLPRQEGTSSVRDEEEAPSSIVETGPEWDHDTDEHLLRELRSRRGEMERIMKSGGDEDSVRELATFLSELRELHAHLRLHDRRNGVKRERWRMGVPTMK
ncbi:MAG TPA: hypothetical protein VN397_03885 [Candidatus Methylomirabilis sp.]|nr:hypothetical protein [Candidatus Methylomirabilis sp.]